MTNLSDTRAERIATALATHTQIAPLSSEAQPPTGDDAYAIADQVRRLQGLTPIGRKVGFTNRAIWPIYGVHEPIWGAVYAEGLLEAGATLSCADFSEPRIEPEIVLGLKRAPSADMDRDALAACIDWVAPGFEIVQSIYPGWKISLADSIAAQAMHGALVLGDKRPATAEVLGGLPAVPLTLERDGETVETGVGANALGGPLEVLAHLVKLLPDQEGLVAGELIATGTLTDAWVLSPGTDWRAIFGGVMDAEITVRCT